MQLGCVGSVIVLGEGQATVLALEVVEHARVYFFAHSRPSQAAGGAARQASQDRSSKAAQGNSNRPCDCSQGCAALSARQSASGAAGCSTNSTNYSAEFASMITRDNAQRTARRTANSHLFRLLGNLTSRECGHYLPVLT